MLAYSNRKFAGGLNDSPTHAATSGMLQQMAMIGGASSIMSNVYATSPAKQAKGAEEIEQIRLIDQVIQQREIAKSPNEYDCRQYDQMRKLEEVDDDDD